MNNWNLQDGQVVHTFEGHTHSVLNILWFCHGLELISAAGDGIIKLWNISKGICINTFEKHEGRIWAFDRSGYDSDGNIINKFVFFYLGKQYIVSGGSDSVLVIWQDTTIETEKQVLEEKHRV